MNIIISNASDKPIYDQIYTEIKKAILSGELSEGDALPSIRSLAKDLRISVITTKRAYDELEQGGFINTVAAKGCYVAPLDKRLLREQHLQEIEACIKKIIFLSEPLGITEEEIIETYRILSKEDRSK